jgi:hypothetical protein
MTGLDSLPRPERKVRLAPWRWPALEARLRHFICRRSDEAAQAPGSALPATDIANAWPNQGVPRRDGFHNATDVAGARRTPSD